MSDSKYAPLPTEDPEDPSEGQPEENGDDDGKKKKGKDKPEKKDSKASNDDSKKKKEKRSSSGGKNGDRSPRDKKKKSKTPSDDGDGDDSKNKVQFAAPQFFCTEDTNVTVRVMRLGAVDETCKVKYHTEEGSARAGVKYIESSGVLKFDKGELYKTFEVKIIASTTFDTVLEFFVELEPEKGCTVCPHLRVCRVMVLDNDTFPDTKFKDIVSQHDDEILQENGVALLMAYMRLALWSVPGVWWKALLTLLFDQLENVYDLGMVYLRVYLVDVVLNPEADEAKLLGDTRIGTAYLLASLYIGPCLVLFIIERLKQGPWYMGAALNDSLKVNIFRKYLNFTDASRRVAPIQELTGAMSGDVADLVENGFMGMFEVVQYFGKILSTGFFVVSKNPSNAVPLALYPLILITFTWCRQSRATELQDNVDEADGDVMGTVLGTHRDFEIITDYAQRGAAVDQFELQLKKLQKADFHSRIFMFYNEQLVPMITNMIVAAYICVGASQVLSGGTTVGAFIATVTIFQTLGTKFEKIYSRMRTWLTAVGPVVGVTHLLSLSTTTRGRMAKSQSIAKQQNEFVEEMQEAQPGLKESANLFNELPIKLSEVAAAKISSLRDMTIEVPQGQMVAIIGPHASGKSALMKLIVKGSEKGYVFLPEHLRCLNVSHLPIVLEDRDLLENLCFGSRILEESLSESDQSRIVKICKRVGFSKKLLGLLDSDIKKKLEESKKKKNKKKEEEDEEEEEEEDEDIGAEVDTWCAQLSNSEKRRIHLARAFIFDPEVMILHKPLNDLDKTEIQSTLELLRDLVQCRGLENDPNGLASRTPRSLFVSVGAVALAPEELRKVADTVWTLVGDGKLDVKPGGKKGGTKSKDEQPNLLDDE